MNVIAGILIGVMSDSWLARLAIPFIWGISYCLYLSLLRTERLAAFIAKDAAVGRGRFQAWSPAKVFYFIEYTTSVCTSLIFFVVAGFVAGLFR